MTDDNAATDQPDTTLPKFSVNVAPTEGITAAHLSSLIERYRDGETEPLVFGDDNVPEAAIIPFAAFVRLLKRDHADAVREEHAFQSELLHRIQDADASRDPGITLDELGDELGEPARSMLRKARDDD
ncbi:hypothetical protein [Arthrobacter rhizosphaerae]|uniref:hypothetical protein n=1 Tax=Arthrobacter rhizosphaerae TaxID=2855490 RepID=UPI001FF289EB|nr:hypothetical protein [Arthrobacter rhizosphaerae]